MEHPLPAIVCLSVSMFATASIPVLLLAEADHLTPGWLRALPAATYHAVHAAPLTAAALLMLLGGTR
ncbi:hypothetical protein ACFV1G_21315 [Streptomyces anulatus]|uniref:hypothetical protein n=1 Tax=Streptomyces anulatus TaxID=1892 RepID=UPI00367FCECE